MAGGRSVAIVDLSLDFEKNTPAKFKVSVFLLILLALPGV
jgi:hypothetical protein